MYATGWYNLPGTTYRYEQLDLYYCVPATVQTILRYNNGTTPPVQSTIATDMGYVSGVGIDFLNVSTYLNANQQSAKAEKAVVSDVKVQEVKSKSR